MTANAAPLVIARAFNAVSAPMARIYAVYKPPVPENLLDMDYLGREADPGERVVFTQHFPTASGRARFVPADIVPADERPDAAYPLVLITGRQLEHWHTGSMTRRTRVLDSLEPEPVAMLHPLELQRLGIAPGAAMTVLSRRGQVTLYARADDGVPMGAVFVALCWAEAVINLLTNPALDPVAKIAEFKYCAVRVEAAAEGP